MIGASVETVNGLVNAFFALVDAISFIKGISFLEMGKIFFQKLRSLVLWLVGLKHELPSSDLDSTNPLKVDGIEGNADGEWSPLFSEQSLKAHPNSRLSSKVRIGISVLCLLPAIFSIVSIFGFLNSHLS
jgi:hypothetical protein